MSSTDSKIAEVLATFGEPVAGNVWRVQGQPVIYHKTLERIAAQAKIRFESPHIIRGERDEAVILVMGYMGERSEWSIGEALIGVNYRVSGKQAAYVWAMAEKRAKDRVILKLIELHGLLYSEEEADEFKDERPSEGDAGGQPKAGGYPKPQIVPTEPEAKSADDKRKLSELQPSVQAALTAKRPAFWRFLNETFGANVSTESGATDEIYKACGVESRSDLVPDSKAEMRWQALRQRFERWLNEVPA